jgi:hypothetical protein
MRIINGKQLGYMPDGTVFSDIKDKDFNPDDYYGAAYINGIHIMCGHGNYCPIESGEFNGVMHMLDYVPVIDHLIDIDNLRDDEWNCITDTDSNDYTENDWVVVYDRKEVEMIIDNLQWALRGCNDNKD